MQEHQIVNYSSKKMKRNIKKNKEKKKRTSIFCINYLMIIENR